MKLHSATAHALFNTLLSSVAYFQRRSVARWSAFADNPNPKWFKMNRRLDHRLKEHRGALASRNLAQSALQNIRLMSRMSWIGKRPQWWTLTHDTSRNVHLSRGTSGPRPLQWTETMAAYHRLITLSSTTRANHTHHTRPHTILSILNYMLSPTSSQPLNILIPLHHHINYPQPSQIHLFTIHSSLYSPQMLNPKLSVGL